MLDERVRALLTRLEEEDRTEREAGIPSSLRSRQVAPTTGRFLFAIAASQPGIEVLEIGSSRGYSSIWLASGARVLGGRLTSLESDPVKCEAWRVNVAEARQKPLDGKEHQGASRTSGRIGFAGHNDPVAFRNIRVKRIEPK